MNPNKTDADNRASISNVGLAEQRVQVLAQLDDAMAALRRYSTIKGVRKSDIARAAIGPAMLKKRLDAIDALIYEPR